MNNGRNLEDLEGRMKNLHIVNHKENWAVKKGCNKMLISLYRTQATAIAAATRIARKEGYGVVIHDSDEKNQEQKSTLRNERSPAEKEWVLLAQ